MIDVFLSYQNEDRLLALKLSKALLDMGYSVWWDVNLLPGDDFQSEIQSVIENAKAVIVLWTSKAVDSHFVRDEANLALQLKKLISTSYNIDIDSIPLGFKQIQTLDIKSAFDAPKFSLPDEIVQAIEKKIIRTGSVQNEEMKTKLVSLEAGPADQINAWKVIENKKYDKAEYDNFLEEYGYNTPLSVVAQNRISEHQTKKQGSLQQLLFWFVLLPAAAVGLYLNVPKLIEKLSNPNHTKSSVSEPVEPKPTVKEAVDKTEKTMPKTVKVLPTSLSPQKVIGAANAATRYKGWRIPNDGWFGKVNSISIQSANKARVFLSSTPGDISIFVYSTDLPPDIHKNDYVKIEGEVDGVSSHITLVNGSVVKTDRATVFRRFRKDYDNVICVQKKMSDYGYYTDFIDGINGYNTTRAVTRFLNNSPILEQLSLTKSATSGEVCSALKTISRAQYVKMVDDNSAQKLKDRINRSSTRHQTNYKPYKETLYDSLVETDDETWSTVTRRGKAKGFYEYLLGSHLKYELGDRARLEKSDNRLKNRKLAMQRLGISFDPSLATPPSIFMNTNKKMGTAYTFELSVNVDENYLFHEGEELHGVSTCLNTGLLSQCYADGVCTEKDFKYHGNGSVKACIVLKVQKTFLGSVVSSEIHEDLCQRFETYINDKTGHNTEAWVNTPYGYEQCFLHYSKEELNRIFSK